MATRRKSDTKRKVIRCARGFRFVKKGREGKDRIELRSNNGDGPVGAILRCACFGGTTVCGYIVGANGKTASYGSGCRGGTCEWLITLPGLSGNLTFVL